MCIIAGTVRTALFPLLLIAALAGCGRETRIRVAIEGDATSVDSFQVKVEDRFATAVPQSGLEFIVPDAMAGTSVKVELWGLRAGEQVAYGAAMTTPALHGNVDVTVALSVVACGPWCRPGALTCTSNGTVDGTQTCVQDADGCVAWSTPTACTPPTPFCSNGACSATCSDECSAGASECDSGAAVRTCGQYDNDECLDLSPAVACGAGQTCRDGACSSTQTCTTGDDCDDGNACTSNDTCSGGVCAGEAMCEDKAPECINGNTLRMYGLGGTCSSMTSACTYSYIDATCPLGCTNGACRSHAAAGGNNSCAIRSTGALACWGAMANSSLASGSFAAISVKEYHGCGTTTAGATVCWARDTFGNFYGECDVPSGTFSSVTAGDGFTCAVRTTGALACWGDSTMDQLAAPTGTYKAVSSGTDHSCALRANDNTAVCWGRNDLGQASALGGSFTHVAAGYQFSCGIRPGGAIECWGSIDPPPSGAYLSLSAGFDHACAVRSDGVPKCWGSNANGKRTPPSGTFSSVTAGDQHTCGVRANGSIACWGDPSKGATVVPGGL